MSMPAPAVPSRKKSPQLRPTGPNSLMSDLHDPVAPAVLAEAISKLDNLRLSRTNSKSKSPQSNGTPASGSSSPDLDSKTEKVINALANAAAEGRTMSAPGTPHFGAQSEM